MKIHKIKDNEELEYRGFIFTVELIDNKARFKFVRKHDGKVKKVKLDSVPAPLEADVRKYAIDNGYNPDFMWERMKGYIAAEMKDSHGNHVRNWKLKLNQVWFKPEHKIKQELTKEFFQEGV